jgi:menaquinone-specific isochorismate synthase
MVFHHSSNLRAGSRPDLRGLVGGERISFSGIRRFEWDLEDLGGFSPLWLDAAAIYPKVFWRSRSGSAQTLAVGELRGGHLRELLPLLVDADEGVRLFGGERFASSSNPVDGWKDFPERYFFIPQAEIIHAGGRTLLAVNLAAGEQALDEVEEWVAALAECPLPHHPAVLTRWDQPNFHQWSTAVDTALGGFADGPLRKVVLARRSTLELVEKISPYALLSLLMGAAPACFHYCFQPSATAGAFLGASPELLYRRMGARLESEAVAGTRPRSLDAAEDERLEFQLLKFSKEQLEHRLVVEALEQTFRSLCMEYACDEKPGVLKLSRVQHLRTAVSGTLNGAVDDATILEAFHPTPATCGAPVADALQFIFQHEKFDRGWYAGPFGCVSRNTAEFAVAIRSMLAKGSRVEVFAGAGIVEGSDPEREWFELEDKISGVLNVLSA